MELSKIEVTGANLHCVCRGSNETEGGIVRSERNRGERHLPGSAGRRIFCFDDICSEVITCGTIFQFLSFVGLLLSENRVSVGNIPC